MEGKKRVALYCRYSTHTQSDNFSIEIQKERMEAMCKSKGWDVGETFIDAAYSGSNMERPDLQNLLSRLDEFDVVMVYRLDRLSRSQRDTMTLIQDYFLKSDTAFVSVSETLDTTTPFGMAMIGILAVFAELERATITERMQSGIKKKVEAGYRINGGNHAPTGYAYKKTENGLVLIPDADKAEMVRKMFEYYEIYSSVSKVMMKLKSEGYKVKKYTTVYQILKNPLYIGKVTYLNETYNGIHEALITKEQFDRVQLMLEAKPKGGNFGKNKESLFGGLITCGRCGEKYSTYSYKVKNQKKGDYYVRSYVCTARRLPVNYDHKCMNENYKDEVIMKEFKQQLNNVLNLKSITYEKKERKPNYDLAIRRIDEKITRLIDLYEDGEIDKATLNKRISIRNEEKQDILNQQKTELQNEAVQLDLSQLKKSALNISSMDFPSKRALVEQVLKGIVIDGDDVIFDWNL